MDIKKFTLDLIHSNNAFKIHLTKFFGLSDKYIFYIGNSHINPYETFSYIEYADDDSGVTESIRTEDYALEQCLDEFKKTLLPVERSLLGL